MTSDESSDNNSLTIVIHNEDNGNELELAAGPGTPVGTVIQRMYAKWRIEPQSGDRLRCDEGGSVLGHEAEHLGDFVAAHCPSKTWVFVGDQGGAGSV